MFISITRLRLRHWWTLPAFLWWSSKSMSQAAKADGFERGYTMADRRLAFWTKTAWRNEGAMKAYRGSGSHGAVMPKLAVWCDEASVAHWEAAELPSWKDGWDKLQSGGRFQAVHQPSEAHRQKRIDPPRPLIESPIR